jgi:hypothetical protein
VSPLSPVDWRRQLAPSNLQVTIRCDRYIVFTTAQNPHLARYVRTSPIRVDSYSVLSSFYRLLRATLSNISQLMSPGFFLNHATSWVMHMRDDSIYHSITSYFPFILMPITTFGLITLHYQSFPLTLAMPLVRWTRVPFTALPGITTSHNSKATTHTRMTGTQHFHYIDFSNFYYYPFDYSNSSTFSGSSSVCVRFRVFH